MEVTEQRRAGVLRTIGVDALVVAAGVGTYFGVRGLTAGSPDVARDHAADVLALERRLGLDVEAGIQDLLVEVDPLITFANWVYIWGHWPAIALTLVWLAVQNRTVFLRMRNAMIASGLMGLCVYTTYPVAPPRLTGQGFVDTITEQSHSYRVLQPPAFVNQYAAMPSLHVGWDLVLGLALIAAASSVLVRTIGRLMPVLMAAATVLTANHYILDVLIGAAFGLAGWAVALLLERRREARAPAVRVPLPQQRQDGPIAPDLPSQRDAEPTACALPQQRRPGAAPCPHSSPCEHGAQ